ncbi:MAG: SUMF1/EgtB/PvdO family nonheme iron enzyme [Opitutaceae bacterium]|nr:SUMF1/EgtB/PvdO family nonheme iron enzyme [Opitutaceae bacterium]
MLVPSAERVVGTSLEERQELAKRFACDPTWLNDDLEKRAVHLAPFWIDRFPVSNGQYYAFVEATGARAPWFEGRFPAAAADHPVVGISYPEAEAYAKWVGKRLPTAEEWEVAAQPGKAGLFLWGDDWPGPVQPLPRSVIPDWQRPGTKRLGSGQHGRSAAGMEDFIQQVCEWTSSTMPHHGTTFVQVKGTSWLNEDPVNFRTAASSWAAGFFSTPWIGFRCALDGASQPAAVPSKIPPGTPPASDTASPAPGAVAGGVEVYPLRNAPADLDAGLLWWNRNWLGGSSATPIPQSRGFLFRAPVMGPWPVCLFLAEMLSWNGKPLLTLGPINTNPSLEEIKTESGRPAYRLTFKEIGLTYEFVAGADFVDLLTTIANRTDQAGTFSTSSCFSLTCNPLFYDGEMVRTYQLTRNAGFVPLRQIPRPGDCVRWIEPSDSTQYGGPGNPGTMAVVSRDGKWTFASVRFETGAAFTVQGNTWLNCLHTDAPVTVDAHSSRTTRQRLYFLRGDLKTLQSRLQQDLGTP